MMTPDSCGLQIALTLAALLLAALGTALLFRGARGDSHAPSLDLSDAGIRIGAGAGLLRFRLEVQPTGRPAFRAETLSNSIPR